MIIHYVYIYIYIYIYTTTTILYILLRLISGHAGRQPGGAAGLRRAQPAGNISYVSMHVCTHVCVYIYIYIYIHI